MVDVNATVINASWNDPVFLGLHKSNFIRHYQFDPKQMGPRNNRPYFFIRGADGMHHCRVTNKGFLEYTVPGTKRFNTLHEWAESLNHTIESIRFGYETYDPMYMSMTLDELINKLEKVYLPVPVPMDPRITELVDKMESVGLGFNNLAVVSHTNVMMADKFMVSF